MPPPRQMLITPLRHCFDADAAAAAYVLPSTDICYAIAFVADAITLPLLPAMPLAYYFRLMPLACHDTLIDARCCRCRHHYLRADIIRFVDAAFCFAAFAPALMLMLLPLP